MIVRLSRSRRRFVILLSLFPLLLLYAWLIEPNWVEVTRHESRSKNLPEAFNGLVVAHLSDLHLREYGLRERRVLDLLAEAKPGVIVLTGDFMQEGQDPDALRRFLRDLSKQTPAFGIWAVLGHHDHQAPLVEQEGAVKTFFSDSGVALLVNEWGRIGTGLDTLTLVGVDDSFTGRDNLGVALSGTQRTPFAILLTHSPQLFRQADRTRFDLVLTGHTHGGQVRLPGLGALWLPDGSEEYESGWFFGQYTQMFVTRGIGTSRLPFRLLCRPEIALITLTRGRT